MGLPVGVGALDGAVALCAVAPEPLKLGLVVGGPIGTGAHHLRTGQRLRQAVRAGAWVRGCDIPTGLMRNDVHGGGEIGLGIAAGQQIIVSPLLHFASRHGGADRRCGRGRRGRGAGADEDHLVGRSLLHERADHIGRHDLAAGLGDEVRGLHNTVRAFGLDLLLALRQAGGLLLDRVERDIRIRHLNGSAGTFDLDDGVLVHLRIQRRGNGVFRIKGDVARVKHGLHVGEMHAGNHAGLAVDLHGDVRSISGKRLTGVATGGFDAVGDGIRGDLLGRRLLRGGVQIMRHDAASGQQPHCRNRCDNLHHLRFARQGKRSWLGMFLMASHSAPTSGTIPRRIPCLGHGAQPLGFRRNARNCI